MDAGTHQSRKAEYGRTLLPLTKRLVAQRIAERTAHRVAAE